MANADVNTIFFDGSVEDLAIEYAEFIDKLDGEEAQRKFKIAIQTLLENQKIDEVLQEVLKTEPKLFGLQDKEFEGAFNLLIALIHNASPSTYESVITSTLSTIEADETPDRAIPKLRTLSNLYNTIEVNSKLRYLTFMTIVKVAAKDDELDIVTPQLSSLDSWLSNWNLSIDETRNLYRLLAEKLKEGGELHLSYQYLVKLLRTYEAGPEAKALAIQAVVDALAVPSQYDYEFLLQIPSISALEKEEPPAFNLLQVFIKGDLKDYKAWEAVSENVTFLKARGLSSDANTRKIRHLTLSSLAASNLSKEIPYASIAQALEIPLDDVEMWVIDVIRAGLIEGKLSQTRQSIAVHRSTFRSFGTEQWKALSSNLESFKTSLDGILQVLTKAKANVSKHGGAVQLASAITDSSEKIVGGR